MPEVSHSPLTFDQGLYDVSNVAQGSAASLPLQSKVNPSQEPVTSRLSDMFADRSFENGLLEAIRPDVSDTSVLSPQNFSQLLDEVKEEARETAKQTRNRDTRHQFEELGELMSRETILMDALQQDRSLLLQA